MTREQFVEQVGREQAALRRFLTALCCGNSAEADDIAQEALIKAYLRSSQYDERGQFSAWLMKIAYRVFIDSRRKQKHQQEYPLRRLSRSKETVRVMKPSAIKNYTLRWQRSRRQCAQVSCFIICRVIR